MDKQKVVYSCSNWSECTRIAFISIGKYLVYKQRIVQSSCFNSSCVPKSFPLPSLPPSSKEICQTNPWTNRKSISHHPPVSIPLANSRETQGTGSWKLLPFFWPQTFEPGVSGGPENLGSLRLGGINGSGYAAFLFLGKLFSFQGTYVSSVSQQQMRGKQVLWFMKCMLLFLFTGRVSDPVH